MRPSNFFGTASKESEESNYRVSTQQVFVQTDFNITL